MNQDLLQQLLQEGTRGTEERLQSGVSDQVQLGIKEAIEPYLSAIKPLLTVLVILAVVMLIVFIVNTIYKIRVERAILRMDRNLQKFLATQPSNIADTSSAIDKQIK